MSKLSGYYAVAVIKQKDKDGNDKNYYFAIFDDNNTYAIGDEIIVSGITKGVVKIENILTPEEAANEFNGNIFAEVVAKVDRSAYSMRKTKRKVLNNIQKEMNDVIDKKLGDKKYELLAKEDSELKELFESYKEMTR